MNILLFEDNKTTQQIVTKYTEAKLGAKTLVESTLFNADLYLKTHYIDKFDIVVCDYCFPLLDATEKLEELRDCGKPVLFYTALSEDDFLEKVVNKLGALPVNFQHIRKATKLNLFISKIKLMVGIK